MHRLQSKRSKRQLAKALAKTVYVELGVWLWVCRSCDRQSRGGAGVVVHHIADYDLQSNIGGGTLGAPANSRSLAWYKSATTQSRSANFESHHEIAGGARTKRALQGPHVLHAMGIHSGGHNTVLAQHGLHRSCHAGTFWPFPSFSRHRHGKSQRTVNRIMSCTFA